MFENSMEALNESVSYCIYSAEKLFNSISCGEDVVTIQNLLQDCADIDARDADGYTPLLLACHKDRKEIVDLLINCGANVDAKCYSNGYSVLHYASKKGWTNIVRTLVEKVPDLNARDIRGETAMHHASRSGCLEIVKCLVDKGAVINTKNSANLTPLLCAAKNSQIDVVYLLLNSGANIDGYEGKLLFCASIHGWTNLVRSLVKRVPDLNQCPVDGRPALSSVLRPTLPLHVASRQGHLEIVKCLLEEGADINKENCFGVTALQYASCRHLEIVKLLVERGIDINSRSGVSALIIAAGLGQVEIVKFLVEKGADINMTAFGTAPVLKAAQYRQKDIVDLLIYYGVNIDVHDENKHTLLHYASRFGWLDTVQSIVKRNCDLDARNIYGKTALGFACKYLHLDIVQYLSQAGASCSSVDNSGYSILNYVTIGRKEPEFNIIKLLIENGAYLKQYDYKGIVRSSSLKVLQDVKLCCRSIVNKFNNHDLLQLSKLPASGNLPRIEEMKIASGSEVALAIKRAVEFEIQTKGHCNVLEVHPMVLRVLSVRTVLEYCKKRKSEEWQNQSKRRKVE